MSRKNNTPYKDQILKDGITIKYQGHDQPRKGGLDTSKLDQKEYTEKNSLTQNGKFIKAIKNYTEPIKYEFVKVYEKIHSGVWSFKGFFELINYEKINDGNRFIYIYELKLSKYQNINIKNIEIDIKHNRLIPSQVKKEVWKRDKGECVLCGSKKNLHFDHDLPFSKGGTSLISKNIKLLCMKCNLQKSDKIQ